MGGRQEEGLEGQANPADFCQSPDARGPADAASSSSNASSNPPILRPHKGCDPPLVQLPLPTSQNHPNTLELSGRKFDRWALIAVLVQLQSWGGNCAVFGKPSLCPQAALAKHSDTLSTSADSKKSSVHFLRSGKQGETQFKSGESRLAVATASN